MFARSVHIPLFFRQIRVINPSHVLTQARYASTSTSSNDIKQSLRNIAKRIALVTMGYKVLAFGTVVGALGYTLYYDSEYAVINEMVKRFENPSLQEWDESDAATIIARDDIQKLIKPLIHNENYEKMYAAIVGESGTGKSTAVRKAIRSINGAKGVIYCLIASESEYSSELQTALAFRATNDYFQRYISKFIAQKEAIPTTPKTETDITWYKIKPLLKAAAIKYKSIHKKQPVLVIDAADKLAKWNSVFFRYLQEFAKESADSGIIRVVFVFSDSVALPTLRDKTNSYNSRLGTIVEVGDIADEDAIKFLEKQYKMENTKATEMVKTITGGRFKMLYEYGKSTDTLAKIREELNDDAETTLNYLKISPSAPIFFKLLEAGPSGLPIKIASTLIEKEKCSLLLQNNIISQHPNRRYTFYSRQIEKYIQSKIEQQRIADQENQRQIELEQQRIADQEKRRWFRW